MRRLWDNARRYILVKQKKRTFAPKIYSLIFKRLIIIKSDDNESREQQGSNPYL